MSKSTKAPVGRDALTPEQESTILLYATYLGAEAAIDRLVLGMKTMKQVERMVHEDAPPPAMLRIFAD